MTKNEWEQDSEHQELEKKAFHRGYIAGAKAEGEASKRVEHLENVLLEFVGYEDEWLQTKPGLMKRKKADLVDQIIRQRQLMRELYNHLDDDVKQKLRTKVKSYIWPVMHREE
ncbi:hypothetical protein [Bacillus haynesii]|uniref:hypothetical protein n=1 Tax=Bacillus haynesii TaxID=1925021 RepID=UPI0003EDA1C8|nr:hypothetical protein [Bacillus haynesii]EWH19857.1 hypothetical protein M769_0124560 [Bacillus haynesii]